MRALNGSIPRPGQWRGLRTAALSAVLLLCSTLPAWSQQRSGSPPDTAALRRTAEQRLGRNVSQADVIAKLRQSGMSRAEVRAQLQREGYDPNIADRYFDVIEKGMEPPTGEVSADALLALSRISAGDRPLIELSGRDTSAFATDSLRADSARSLEVFGLRVFRRTGTEFEPTTFGPVDPSYRLGPGDEVTLVLTGDVEESYPLRVTRDGQLFIPEVGQVTVNNLTLAQLTDVLYARLGRVYSGISRSAGATTRFQVILGQLRANQIYITGDVAAPGSYQVSSVAGLFNALYQAGGPTAQGSFRRVEVWRGGRLFHTADLYDFLVRGDGSSDVRLEQNDRIFVPPVGTQVTIQGAVRRPAIYEIKSNETVRDALRFAGGLSAEALASRVQIDRILPPAQQTPGHYRTLVDVSLANLGVGLADGDVLRVSAVPDERRNRIVLSGEVRTPGLFEYSPGMTLWSLLERADGLGDRAYTARAHIYRRVASDGTRRLIQATLERDEAGRPLHDLPLADGDSIVVFSRAALRNDEFVSIEGLVKEPDQYPLAEGMTVRDLVLAAGGFLPGASVLRAEVSRVPDPRFRSDTTAFVYTVTLTSGDTATVRARDQSAAEYDRSLVPEWVPGAGEFPLQNGDHVFIRRAAGFEKPRLVAVTGEVVRPGTYILQNRTETLTDLLGRAGGLTPEAYPSGLHVVRDHRVIAADLTSALRDPDSRSNIVLEDGDSIYAPEIDQMVTVTGSVVFETSVLYRAGKGLSYYLDQAGGTAPDADQNRTTVTYPNGERRVVRHNLMWTSTPDIQPGSEIFVPAKPASRTGTNWGEVIGRVTAVAGTLATLLIAIKQLN